MLDTSLGWTLRGRNILCVANWGMVEQAPDYPKPNPLKWLAGKLHHRSIEEVIWLPYGSGNYYHFMVDMLGGLKLVQDHLDVFNVPILISRSLWETRYFQEFRANSTVLSAARWIIHEQGEWIRTSHLMTAKSWFSGIETFHDAIGLLDLLPAEYPQAVRRLYITRSSMTGRIPANESDLTTALVERGFETVKFEGLSLIEQVALINSGAIFVAIHGAGLANFAFHTNPAGKKLFEITPADLINPCFAFMADEAGMDYSCFVGGPRNFNQNGNFDVPLEAFKGALDEFLEADINSI